MKPLGVDGWRRAGGAVMSEEREPKPLVSGVLVREQAEEKISLIQCGPELCSVPGPLEEEDAGLAPKPLEDAVDRVRFESTVGGCKLPPARERPQPGKYFEIAKVPQGDHGHLAIGRDKGLEAGDLDAAANLRVAHRGGLDSRTITLTKPLKVFLGNCFNSPRVQFGSQGEIEVLQGDPPMTAVQAPRDAAEEAAEPGRDVERDRLEKCDDEVSDASEEGAHEKASVR